MGMNNEKKLSTDVTIDAPSWVYDAGFPEDMPYTERVELPQDTQTIEPYVVDAMNGQECEILHADDQYYKVLRIKE